MIQHCTFSCKWQVLMKKDRWFGHGQTNVCLIQILQPALSSSAGGSSSSLGAQHGVLGMCEGRKSFRASPLFCVTGDMLSPPALGVMRLCWDWEMCGFSQAQPQGFGGHKWAFEIEFLNLVVNPKASDSPSPQYFKVHIKKPPPTQLSTVETRFFVLFVYLFKNPQLILNIHWCCPCAFPFELVHTHRCTHSHMWLLHILIHVLTFSSRVVSCSSSLTGSVPSGRVPLPLSWLSSGKSQGSVDSAISSSVALMTFRTSVDMLQRETAEYFYFVTRTDRENNSIKLAQRGKI